MRGKNGEALFPIMDSDHIKAVPWAMMQPHERQAQHNHSQTLERLAQRGGLCPSEAVDVLTGQGWNTQPQAGAEPKLLTMLAAHLSEPHPKDC